MKEPKFRPRRINDEMPPLGPTAIRFGSDEIHHPGAVASMRNCRIVGYGTGINAQNLADLTIENLATRGTLRPIDIKKARRIYLRGLDFQR